MTVKTDAIEAREEQRKASKRATFDMLRNKKAVEKTISFNLNDEDDPHEVEMLFRAISHVEYDRIQSKCPPTTEQRAQGEPFNVEEFAPSLLSKVVIEPEMSIGDWKEIWSSPSWSRGECANLFAEAVNICTRGLDIPFTVSD